MYKPSALRLQRVTMTTAEIRQSSKRLAMGTLCTGLAMALPAEERHAT